MRARPRRCCCSSSPLSNTARAAASSTGTSSHRTCSSAPTPARSSCWTLAADTSWRTRSIKSLQVGQEKLSVEVCVLDWKRLSWSLALLGSLRHSFIRPSGVVWFPQLSCRTSYCLVAGCDALQAPVRFSTFQKRTEGSQTALPESPVCRQEMANMQLFTDRNHGRSKQKLMLCCWSTVLYVTDCRQLIRWCLRAAADERPSLQDIEQHPWLRSTGGQSQHTHLNDSVLIGQFDCPVRINVGNWL